MQIFHFPSRGDGFPPLFLGKFLDSPSSSIPLFLPLRAACSTFPKHCDPVWNDPTLSFLPLSRPPISSCPLNLHPFSSFSTRFCMICPWFDQSHSARLRVSPIFFCSFEAFSYPFTAYILPYLPFLHYFLVLFSEIRLGLVVHGNLVDSHIRYAPLFTILL